MKLIAVILFFSTLALGQEYPAFDSGLDANDQLSDFVTNVYIPAAKDSGTTDQTLTEYAQTMIQMANNTQVLLASDLEENRIDFFEYARNLVKIKELVAQTAWYTQGLDAALNRLATNMGPLHNSNLELQLLESAYTMIVTDRDYVKEIDLGRDIATLKQIVGHLQFMRNPNPDARRNQSYYLITLAERLMAVNQKAEALSFMEAFFQKAQTCDCMRPITVTGALEKYSTWLASAENRTPSFSTAFNNWYNSLITSPELIIQPDSIAQEVAYQKEMEILIQTNLNEMTSSTDH